MSNTQVAEPAADVRTPEQLLDWARSMGPILRERGPQGDQDRQLPAETVADYKAAGLIRAFQPKRFGGYEHDMALHGELGMQLARADGASGWLASFYSMHQYQVGWFSEQAQEEYWADSPDTLAATVPGFAIQPEVVKGGIRVSGRTSFSSGIDHVDWLLFHTMTHTGLIRRSEVEIIDDWEVSGLRGTGSKGVLTKDVFIPDYRLITTEQMLTATFPGADLYDNPWYHAANPVLMVLNQAILAPIIGMARGVLDLFDERARTRIDPLTFKPAIEGAPAQLRYARSAAEIEFAEYLLRTNYDAVRESATARSGFTMEQRATYRRNIAFAAQLAREAVNRLVDGMDSSSLYDRNHLHRMARDLRAGGLQFVVHSEETMMQYSRVHWGLEPNTFLI